MLAKAAVRHLVSTASLLAAVLLPGCGDASTPLAPPRSLATPDLDIVPGVTVTNTNDAGDGSLRQAIIDLSPGGTIRFDPALGGATIVLSTGQLQIGKPTI